jgi:hypothetical protein
MGEKKNHFREPNHFKAIFTFSKNIEIVFLIQAIKKRYLMRPKNEIYV